VSCESRIAEIDRVLASVTRFEALAKEWHFAGCKKEQDVMCPAMLCEATCNAGACELRHVIQ
jgi:hypothetical protein